jgi:hypothetical protein
LSMDVSDFIEGANLHELCLWLASIHLKRKLEIATTRSDLKQDKECYIYEREYH